MARRCWPSWLCSPWSRKKILKSTFIWLHLRVQSFHKLDKWRVTVIREVFPSHSTARRVLYPRVTRILQLNITNSQKANQNVTLTTRSSAGTSQCWCRGAQNKTSCPSDKLSTTQVWSINHIILYTMGCGWMALLTGWTVMSAKSTHSPQLTWDKPPLSILERVHFLLKTDFLFGAVAVLSIRLNQWAHKQNSCSPCMWL